MRQAIAGLLIFTSFILGGCKSTGILAKREAEQCCPTDIRKTVPWCAGEDAIFQCPCRPSSEFYGYKPTCWGIWPASGAAWRDAHCGELHHGAIITDLANQNRELIELPPLTAPPTPSPDTGQQLEPDTESEATDKPLMQVPNQPKVELQPEDDLEEDLDRDNEDLPEPTFGLIRLPSIEAN